MTQPDPPDTGRTRPFADILISLRRGKTHAELSRALQDLVTVVRATGKAGKLTFTLSLKTAKADGMIEVTDAIVVREPVYDRDASLLFADDEANLVSHDPRQTELPLGLRDASSHREAR